MGQENIWKFWLSQATRNAILFGGFLSFYKNSVAFCSWPFSGVMSHSQIPTISNFTGLSPYPIGSSNSTLVRSNLCLSNQPWFPHQLIVSPLTQLPKETLVAAFFRINYHYSYISFNKHWTPPMYRALKLQWSAQRQAQLSRILWSHKEVRLWTNNCISDLLAMI